MMVLLCGEHQKPFHTRLFLLTQYNNNNNNNNRGGGGQYNNITSRDMTFVVYTYLQWVYTYTVIIIITILYII